MTVHVGTPSHGSEGHGTDTPSLSVGQAVKIRLISNNIGYGPPPNYDDEVEQRLTLTADGRAWLSFYSYGLGEGKYKLTNMRRYKLDASKAQSILSSISRYFYEQFVPCFATDIGDWVLHITSEDGSISHFSGSLCANYKIDGVDLSDLLRNSLGIESLWCFNGT